MIDIVERLNDSLSAGYSELRKEAALEIESLRTKIAEMERQEPVAWYSKQYGFVYMSRHHSQFEHGSILYLRNGAPAWRIEGSSKVALLDIASLPHGTVFYAIPAQKENDMDFKREERYIVFKMSDIKEALSTSEIDDLKYLHRVTNAARERLGKKMLECVVVEKDWPEYEPTWRALEARVNGVQQVPDGTAIQTAARILNIDLIRQRDALRTKIEEMEQQEPAPSVPENKK